MPGDPVTHVDLPMFGRLLAVPASGTWLDQMGPDCFVLTKNPTGSVVIPLQNISKYFLIYKFTQGGSTLLFLGLI